MVIPKDPGDASEGLVDWCIELHMSITGTSDALTDDEIDRLTAWIEARVETHWRSSRPSARGFDDAVRAMGRAAVVEARVWGARPNGGA